ncbi:MAG TPA: hypothetical protein VI756_06815 [Blastocatellia bacterium]
MISPAAAHWFKSRREELNGRFARQKRRFGSLDANATLDLVGELVPPLAGDEPGSDELCLALFDILLLHAGRDTVNTNPAIYTLFRSAFPGLRHLLIEAPLMLPGALCNAVENLGPRGVDFAKQITVIGKSLDDPHKLLSAGVVLAWRLGEPRLRGRALRVAADLPPGVALGALGLSDWPPAALPLALAVLEENGWQAPRTRVSAATISAIGAGSANIHNLLDAVASAQLPPLPEWKLLGHVGEFIGFGGSFDSPPVVLNGGGRHRLFVRSGDAFYQVTADCFGSVCRPIADPQLQVRAPQATQGKGLLARLKLRTALDDGNQITPDGVLTVNGTTIKLPALKGATSFASFAGLVAFTTQDSHRVRILAPWRNPL